MILTVTLNTALDLTYGVPELVPHASHRVGDMAERPGGKGLNVARVLSALGQATVVTGFAGGSTGAELRELLAQLAPRDTSGTDTRAAAAAAAVTPATTTPISTPAPAPITDALVTVAGNTRRTIAVVDRATGDTTQLNEPGPLVTADEWAALLDRYEELLTGADAVALCGSLPPGIHVGAYAELIRPARAAGIPYSWTPAANRCAAASPPAPT